MRVLAVAALLSLVGCAEKPERECEKGYHAEVIGCVRDRTTEIRVTIAAAPGGTLCTGDSSEQKPPVLTPETIRVKVDEELQFENADVVAHEIRGIDGSLWLSVPAGQLSPFTSFVKPGTWAYRVSGCAKGGSVIVE